jgi:hypothetical protein
MSRCHPRRTADRAHGMFEPVGDAVHKFVGVAAERPAAIQAGDVLCPMTFRP